MLAKHRGLHISDDQRLRFVTLLSLAADDAGLPADPEFRAAIMGYAELGDTAGGAQLRRRNRYRRACTGSALGMGCGAPVPAVIKR